MSGADARRPCRDKKLTLAQNYRRLGLVARLKAPTGGIEKNLGAAAAEAPSADPFGIASVDKVVVSEVRVERDADGNITRVLGRGDDNPLNDPLCALEDAGADDDEGEWGGIAERDEAAAAHPNPVVRSLIQQSHNPAPKRPRHLSEAEADWLRRLVARHGDDTAAMARDRKLNPMQQTAADIARRIRSLPSAA